VLKLREVWSYRACCRRSILDVHSERSNRAQFDEPLSQVTLVRRYLAITDLATVRRTCRGSMVTITNLTLYQWIYYK